MRITPVAPVGEADAKPAVAEAVLGAQRGGARARLRIGRRAVEVAGVARHRAELAGEPVLGERVEDVGVAVDPDAVVAVADEVERVGAPPVGAHARAVAEHVGQPEHEPRVHPAQRRQARAQLVLDAGRQPVDDEGVGPERLERAAQRLRAQAHERAGADAERARALAAVVERGQHQRVGALRQPDEGGLARAGDQEHRAALGAEGPRDGDVAPQAAEAARVLGVERDALHVLSMESGHSGERHV